MSPRTLALVVLLVYMAIVPALKIDVWIDRQLPVANTDPLRGLKELLRGLLLYAPALIAGAYLLFPELGSAGRRRHAAPGSLLELTATITKIEATGLTIDNLPQYALRVHYELPPESDGGEAHPREAVLTVTPTGEPPRLGDRVTLYTSREHPEQVSIAKP